VRAVLAAVIALLPAPALSHSWYDGDCCSEKDCAEIPFVQTPRIVPGGYILHDGTWVGVDDKKRRDSKDARWHRCEHPRFGFRCLYVPNGGY
jgi:hypothetical protein